MLRNEVTAASIEEWLNILQERNNIEIINPSIPKNVFVYLFNHLIILLWTLLVPLYFLQVKSLNILCLQKMSTIMALIKFYFKQSLRRLLKMCLLNFMAFFSVL